MFKIHSIQLQDYEALGVSNVVSSLMLFFPPLTFLELPKDLLQHFVQELTKLTCSFGQSAANEEAVSQFAGEWPAHITTFTRRVHCLEHG